ncbi:NAD(P)-dependent oxidoreductase [Tateyamaria sp.]|uniref:NAD(P)-dependent oxidoreductase n=1 Tax=Tateyamaria sp. TaxID=1929288 RepID=UPI00329A82C5
MKITVLGATGSAGRRIVAEALSRGHDVTAVARNASIDLPRGVHFRIGNASVCDDVAQLAKDQDVVISAIRPSRGREGTVTETTKALLRGMRKTNARLLVLGGAANLVVPGSGGTRVIDDPNYLPTDLRHIGQASLDQLEACQTETEVDWVYLSPSASFNPGKRTGNYRTGTNELLVDSDGISELSMEDAAVALLDEAERPKHHRSQFTVGY